MRKHLVFGLIGLSCLGLVAAEGTASVRLVKPLSVTKDKDLFFGDYILNADPVTASTAVMMEAYAVSGADVFAIGGNAVTKYIGKKNLGDPHTARFTITGEPGLVCLVTVPSADLALKSEHGSGTLTVKAAPTGDWELTTTPASNGSFSITLYSGATAGQEYFPLDGSGYAKFYVGGVLKLAEGTKSGLYSTSFNVNVAYN